MKYKSYLYILLAVVLMQAISSCSDNYNGQLEFTTSPNVVTVNNTSLSFSYRAESQTVDVTAKGKWDAQTSDAWINVSPRSGADGTTRVTLSVTLNTLKEKRRGTVKIGRDEIVVEQDYAHLTVSAESVAFDEDGGIQSLSVQSNAKWKATVVDALTGQAVDWLTVSPAAGEGNATISLQATKNNKTLRMAYLQFVGTDSEAKTERVIVQQKGSNATVIDIPAFGSDGGMLSDFKHPCPGDFAWTATVQQGVTWLHVSPSSGSGISVPLQITVDKRREIGEIRSAYIELSYMNGMKYQLVVSQEAAYFLLGAERYDFFAKGGTSEPITVQSLSEFSIQPSAAWISARMEEGSLRITAQENLTGSPRQGSVTLTLADSSAKAVIQVNQAAQHADLIVNDYEGEYQDPFSK